MDATSKPDACCRRRLTRRGPRVALLSALAAIVLPKCPLCAGAYLSLLGLGASVPWLAPALVTLRTCAIALACVLALAWIYRLATRRLRVMRAVAVE